MDVEITEMVSEKQVLALDKFAEQHKISLDGISIELKKMIVYATAPMNIFYGCDVDPIPEDPPLVGVIFTLFGRVNEVLNSVLCLLALEKKQSAETLARTLMESSLTLRYFLGADADLEAKVLRYFEKYVDNEKNQNKKWESSLDNCVDEAVKKDHEIRIKEKNEALKNCETFISQIATELSLQLDNKEHPNMFEICKSLGKELDYRTVYAALCSQAHHDAEDILNEFMTSFTHSDDASYEKARERLIKEKDNFSYCLVSVAIVYYLECAGQFGLYIKNKNIECQAITSCFFVAELGKQYFGIHDQIVKEGQRWVI